MTYDKTIAALADPTRRAIFEAVSAEPQSVADLAGRQPVSRPAVSQHLKVLVEAGLVRATPKGAKRIYALDRTGLIALRNYLDQFWTDTLGAYAAEVQRQSTKH